MNAYYSVQFIRWKPDKKRSWADSVFVLLVLVMEFMCLCDTLAYAPCYTSGRGFIIRNISTFVSSLSHHNGFILRQGNISKLRRAEYKA